MQAAGSWDWPLLTLSSSSGHCSQLLGGGLALGQHDTVWEGLDHGKAPALRRNRGTPLLVGWWLLWEQDLLWMIGFTLFSAL